MATIPTVVELGFWDTTTGKAILRIAKLVLAALIGSVLIEIGKGNILFGASTPVIYFILSTAQDILNAKVPNTAADIAPGEHLPPRN